MNPDSEPSLPVARRLVLAGQSAVDGVRRVARDGAGQFVAWELKLPQGASRARQFVHGLWLPMVLARAVLADARVRARWLRYSAAQVVATVVMAVAALAMGGVDRFADDNKGVREAAQKVVAELGGRVDERAEALKRRAPKPEQKLIGIQEALIAERLEWLEGRLEKATGPGQEALSAGELPLLLARALDDAALDRAASRRSRIANAVENLDGAKLVEGLVQVGERLAAPDEGGTGGKEGQPTRARTDAAAPAAAPPAAQAATEAKEAGPEDQDEREEETLAQLLGPAPPLSAEEQARVRRVRSELRAAAMAGVPAAERKIEAARPWSSRLAGLGISWTLIGWLVALWGALYGAQWVVIALCRDYHSELSREACLLAGIAPEDPPIQPRTRVDLRWFRTRVKRYIRGWVVVGVGLPVCWLVSLPFPGDTVRNVLVGGWVLYWQAVFAATKSARAWVDEFVAPAPWFLQSWRWIVEKVPLAWVLGAGVYGRIWERYTRALYAPAECVGQQPAAFTGLMLFRLGGSIPLLKIFIRPLVPVASALLLEAYREHHPARTQMAVLQATPVLPPAAPAAPAAAAS